MIALNYSFFVTDLLQIHLFDLIDSAPMKMKLSNSVARFIGGLDWKFIDLSQFENLNSWM